MAKIDIRFLLLAALCFATGAALGIWMGIAHDFQLAPVHAHLNLLGWTSLALFGLAYKAYPELGRSRLALVHFWLAAPSAVVFPFGIYLSIAHDFPPVAIVASMVWLAGVLIFVVQLGRIALAPSATEFTRSAVPAE